MKKQLTDDEKSYLLPCIQAVLNGEEKQWQNDQLHHPVEAITNTILELEGVKKAPVEEGDEDDKRGFDTNGWQWDWWQYFQHGGKRYVLWGSGYYGGHGFELAD